MFFRSDVEDYDELTISLVTGNQELTSVRLEYSGEGVTGIGAGEPEYFRPSLDPDLVRQARANVYGVWQTSVTRGLDILSKSEIDPIESVGKALFSGLFEGKRQYYYLKSREMAESRRRGLRLRLFIDCPELAVLPWEFLHDGKDFINLSTHSPVVRRMPEAYPRHESFPALNQIRVLLVTIAFDDSGKDNAEPYIESLNTLRATFPQLSLEIIRSASLDQFFNAVQGGSFEILTYLGWDSTQSRGKQELNFLKEGRSESIPNNLLQRVLTGKPELRLIYLCAGNTDLLAGELAPFVPGAIGIMGVINDKPALAFTQGLFTGILQGQPLEAAVTQGRLKIDTAIPGSREWGLPVFYLGATDGALFTLEPPAEEARKQFTQGVEEIIKEPPTDAKSQAEWKKLQSMLTIKLKNLQALQEQKAVFWSTGSQHIESQIEQTTSEITKLRTKIEELT